MTGRCRRRELLWKRTTLWYTEPMSLQSLVQLQILICAVPALAGWMLAPTAQPMLTRVACVAYLPAPVEAVAPAPTEQRAKPAPRATVRQARPPRLTVSVPARPASEITWSLVPFPAAATSGNPFPHATRAP